MKRLLGAILLISAAGFSVAAQQQSNTPPPIPDNPDSLFGSGDQSDSGGTSASSGQAQSAGTGAASGTSSSQVESTSNMFQGDMVQDQTQSAQTENQGIAQALLSTNTVQIGGQVYSRFTEYGYWKDDYPQPTDLGKGFDDQLVPDLQALVYLDARPDEHFRVYGKVQATYPFTNTQTITYTDSIAPSSTQTANLSSPNIDVFELFTDFDYNSKIFFRAGKQVINWGVGYFFNPADVLSLTPIDPQNPTLEREGPVALKMNIPFDLVDNFYTYVVANQAFATDNTFHLDELAVAPMVQFVVGNYELGLGGYYQKAQRPKAIATFSGSIWQFGVFGEGVVSQGADHTLVETAPASSGYRTYTDTTTPYFTGTLGFNYTQTDWNVSVYAQYLFNGQGYADNDLVNGGYALLTEQAQGGMHAGPDLTAQDLQQPGQNYGAATVSWNDIQDSNITLALFWEGNFSDGSGVVSPSVSWAPFDHFTLTAASHVTYGDDDTEFVRQGRMSVSLEADLGEGIF